MAKKQELKADWNQISGIMKVYGTEVGKGKKAFIKYSTSVATKDEDGEYINAYLSVFVSKKSGITAEDLSEGENWVRVDKAFITVEYYQDANNKLIVKPAIMITEGEVVA